MKKRVHLESRHLPCIKMDYPYLKEVDSLALANVQLNLQTAVRNCFDKKRKKRNGSPKFKSSKHSRKSYTTNNQKGTVAIVDATYIRLPKIGNVKAVIHRMPEEGWEIKSATVSQDSDNRYCVAVLFEFEEIGKETDISYDNAIGLDYASDGLYKDSNGNTGSNHKYYRESYKKLARYQKVLSRRKGSGKGEAKSSNYLKQLKKVNRIHTHISNQRKDHLHKKSTEIANQYDVVCVESLDMKAMSNKGFGNGKSTMDNGYGMFVNMLEYKMKDRGKKLVKVDKWYPSSQICSCCGKRHSEMKNLKYRVMRCDCWLEIDRDYNAAINIKIEGLIMLATLS